jgi:murein DD-endopeptidase MepM/ murein hydrolase activator NlpD
MARLELFIPVKPLRINQAFGIYNPAYEQFGFSRHNGIDYAVESGALAYAMCDGIVAEVGYNKGAGNFVRYRTHQKMEAEGQLAYVEFMYMHAQCVLVKAGQDVKAGDPLIECDNTGFSTGRHLHVSAYFVGSVGQKLKVGSPESNYCFDHSKYYNSFFAVDATKVFSLFYQVIALMRAYLNK